MKDLTICLPDNAVFLKNDHPVTTSLKVAEVFGRKHKNVIRAIEKIITPNEFSGLNFEPVKAFNQRNFMPITYADTKGEKRPMYEITRDGFAFLAMGFTGLRAAQFKIAYIDRFNKMESVLKQGFVQSSTQHENYWFARRPHWPLIRPRVLAGQAYREIADFLGMSRGRVARAVKTMIRVGLLAPLKVAEAQRGQSRRAALRYGQGWGQQLSQWQQPSLFEIN